MFLFGCCCTEEKHADEVLEAEKPFPGYSAKVDVFNEVKEGRLQPQSDDGGQYHEQEDHHGHHVDYEQGGEYQGDGGYGQEEQWGDQAHEQWDEGAEQWDDGTYIPVPDGMGDHGEYHEGAYGDEYQGLIVEDSPPADDWNEEPLAAMDEDDFGGGGLAIPASVNSEANRPKNEEVPGVLFRYNVCVKASGRIGLNVKHYDKDKLEVIAVKDGIIKQYNDECRTGTVVCIGDVIEAVNGISGNATDILNAISQSSKEETAQLQISFVRGLPPLYAKGIKKPKAKPHASRLG